MAELASIPRVGTKPTGLLPVPKVREYRARDGSVAEKLAYDVSAFGLNEVRTLMALIAEEEAAQQMSVGNPPVFTNVDGTRGRSILAVRRRLTISFGTRLKVQALNELKRGLMQAIAASTTRRSGRLANAGNWTFRYVRNGRIEPLPLGGSSGIPMGPRDFIVLMPTGVVNADGAYATVANMRVAGSGKLSFRRGAKGPTRRHDQAIGFLALAARAAQASPAFAGFKVSAGFTSRHRVAGELSRANGGRTGYIAIRPNIGRNRRRG